MGASCYINSAVQALKSSFTLESLRKLEETHGTGSTTLGRFLQLTLHDQSEYSIRRFIVSSICYGVLVQETVLILNSLVGRGIGSATQ